MWKWLRRKYNRYMLIKIFKKYVEKERKGVKYAPAELVEREDEYLHNKYGTNRLRDSEYYMKNFANRSGIEKVVCPDCREIVQKGVPHQCVF